MHPYSNDPGNIMSPHNPQMTAYHSRPMYNQDHNEFAQPIMSNGKKDEMEMSSMTNSMAKAAQEEDENDHKFLPIAVVGRIMRYTLDPVPTILRKDNEGCIP